MMTLLDAIYHGKLMNKESTADFLNMLSTNKNSFIPRDLPADLKIANKPGELEAVRNDSGIVFVEGRSYVICVMTSFLRNERDGEEAISKVSLDAWRMFDRLSRASEYGRVVSPRLSAVFDFDFVLDSDLLLNSPFTSPLPWCESERLAGA